MRYIGLKVAVFLVLTTAALLGFLAAEELDKYPGWQGSSLVEVFDNRDDVAWEQVAATLTAVADRQHVGIIRVDEGFDDGDHRRHVYVTSGGPGSDDVTWARDLLTPFGRSPALQLDFAPFEPGDELDPRAAYRVLGPPEAARELATRFEELGLFGTQTPAPTFGQVVVIYGLRSVALTAALLAGLVTLTIGSVLLSARRYAVWRLHGASALHMMLRDARALAPFCATAVLVIGLVVSAFLLWYNGWNQFAVFARLAAIATVAMGAAVALAYVIALLAVSASSVLDALKGRMRLGPAIALLYPLRVVAVLLVVPAVTGVAGDYAGLLNRDDALPHAAHMGDSVDITLPGYRTEEEVDRNFTEVGAWLRQLDARGRAIVMKREPLQDFLPTLASPDEAEVLFVNDTFLAGQPVVDTAGSRVGPTPDNTVRIIVPERLGPHADAIVAGVLRGFAPEALPAGVGAPRVQRLAAANGQTVFVYAVNSQTPNIDGSPMNRPMVRDAVIVSLPNGTPLISDDSLAAWASYNGVVLSPDDVTSSVGQNLPVGRVGVMLPVAGLLADNYKVEARRLISDALTLGLATAVLALAAVSTCALYGRKHTRAIYAGHVAGRSFWRIHRRALLLESTVLLVVLVWICVDNWQRAREVNAYISLGISAPLSTPAPDWWRLIPATTASVAAILLFTVLLLVTHRRTIAAVPNEV